MVDHLGGKYAEDEDEKPKKSGKAKFFEFECPSCNAHNPWGDGFVAKEEVLCHYCGISFEARVSEDGSLKLKEL